MQRLALWLFARPARRDSSLAGPAEQGLGKIQWITWSKPSWQHPGVMSVKKKNAPTEHENEKNPFQWWLHYTAVLSASLSARFRLLSVFCFCPTTLTDFLPLRVAITESALPFQRFNTLQNNLNRCLLRATRAFRPRPCLISHSVDLIFLT